MIHKQPHGTIYTKNGYYYSRISYYIDGKRKTKDQATGITVDSSSKRKSDRQERAALRIMQEHLDEFIAQQIQKDFPTKNQMITDTAQEWLRHISTAKAPGTVASYTTMVRDITLYLSNHPVRTAELTSAQVEAYLDWERTRRQASYTGEHKVASRSKDGAGIENTVDHRYKAISGILQYAKREGIVTRNVASRRDSQISVPKPQHQEFPVLNAEEAELLVASLSDEPLWFHIAVLHGLLYGLRRSEIIGLRISDFDWDTNTLTVSRTVTQQTLNHKNVISVKPFTKNKRPKMFSVIPQLKTYLFMLIDAHKQHRLQFGAEYNQQWQDYLILHPDGHLVSPNLLTNTFSRFIQKHKFKDIRFHDLRHSCASILYANGTDILTIQEILGHAQLTTTIMYTHKISDRKTAALAQLSSQFLPVSVEETEEPGN